MPSHPVNQDQPIRAADSAASPAADTVYRGSVALLAAGSAATSATSPPRCGSGSFMGDLLCDPGTTIRGLLAALWELASTWAPPLTPTAATIVALAIAAVVASAYVRHRAWRRAAAAARWVEIHPPPQSFRDAALAFWHTIAAMLNRTRRRALAPRVLAMEIVATSQTTRLGIWVPPALSVRSILDAVTSAWPGAQVRVTDPPPLVGARRLRAVDLTPRGGAWSPLLHPTHRAGDRRDHSAEEPLAPLLSRLADRHGAQIATVQLLTTAHHHNSSGREGRRAGRLPRGVAVMLLPALCRMLLGVLDVFLTPGHHANHPAYHQGTGSRPEEDAASTAHRKLIETKQASGPHLHASLRVTIAAPRHPRRRTPRPPQRRNLVAALAGGYDPVARGAELVHTRTRHAARRVVARRPGRGFAATVDELAALWHLPAHAARYRITESPGRSWDPRHDLPRIPRRAPSDREPHDDATSSDNSSQINNSGDNDAA